MQHVNNRNVEQTYFEGGILKLTTTAKYSMKKNARLLVYPRKPVTVRDQSGEKLQSKPVRAANPNVIYTYQF